MKLVHLIERLEAVITDARETPLIGGARVDKSEAQGRIDAVRAELLSLRRTLEDGRVVTPPVDARIALDELEELIADRHRVNREHALRLVRRVRDGAGREEIVDPGAAPAYESQRLVKLVDRLDAVVARARPVPLTTQVRITKDEAYDILDHMRAELAGVVHAADEPAKARLGELLPLIDELDDDIHNAAPVPLTDEVRVERGRISTILRQMRAAFSQGTLAALTN